MSVKFSDQNALMGKGNSLRKIEYVSSVVILRNIKHISVCESEFCNSYAYETVKKQWRGASGQDSNEETREQ